MLKVKRPFSCPARPAERGCALSSSSSSSSSSAPEAHRGGPAWSNHTREENPLSLEREIWAGEYHSNKNLQTLYVCMKSVCVHAPRRMCPV